VQELKDFFELRKLKRQSNVPNNVDVPRSGDINISIALSTRASVHDKLLSIMMLCNNDPEKESDLEMSCK